MVTETFDTLSELLKQCKKESPVQFAVVQAPDDTGEIVWQYSRPAEFVR